MDVGISATSDGLRFRVLRPQGQGGLGAVFVAFDGALNRELALKQILDHHDDDSIGRQRFLIEAEITGRLNHPGIVPVYGLGTKASDRHLRDHNAGGDRGWLMGQDRWVRPRSSYEPDAPASAFSGSFARWRVGLVGKNTNLGP